jgi:SAM-dependent methyltransferase
VQKLLRCPTCHARLERATDGFHCTAPTCGRRFPIVDGIPILLNEERSVFRSEDLQASARRLNRERGIVRTLVQGLTPAISANLVARRNYVKLRSLFDKLGSDLRVLIVGGATLGEGIGVLLEHPGIEVVETDVTLGPRVGLVCDAHDLPFEDGSFQCVIAQAVLEHVVDPHRCVEEIHRVLAPAGVVYAETPFMQQVHLGRFDFSRFTHLGHRRLFRHFEEIDSGPAGGPGMALAWSYLYFLLSFSTSRIVRGIIRVFASLTAFHLKYFDHFLNRRAGAYDAAAGYYLIARKSDQVLSDRQLLELYRGAMGARSLPDA